MVESMKMNPGEQDRKAVLCGWALGALDAGFVLTNTEHLGVPAAILLIPLCAMVFYGLGGWLLAKVANGLGKQLNWPLLYWIGAAGVLLLCWERKLPMAHDYHRLAIGIAGSLWLWSLLRREQAPRVVAWLGKLSALAPVIGWGLFWLMQSSAVTHPFTGKSDPADAVNVVLVSWDTVRADTLPLWGGGGLETPALQSLADEGVLFEDFQAVASITGPAHTTMLTGLYPPSHGLRSNGHLAPELEEVRLPELLMENGWHTGAFVSALPVDPKFGFDRGFEIYDYRTDSTALTQLLQLLRFSSSFARMFLPEGLRGTFSVSGDTVVGRASDWYQQQAGAKFMWVHLFDAHGPYLPPEKWKQRALARASEGPHAVDSEDEEELVMQRAEIEQIDQQLADLIENLRKSDPKLENTMLVLVSDHGECFGEGGINLEHESSLFAATQHIPAVIRFPGGNGGGVRRSHGPFSQIDIAPSICGALGIEIPKEWQGVDVMQVEDPTSVRAGIYMEAFMERLGDERLQGWVEGDWKYIRSLAGEERLFKRNDETKDLADSQGEILDYMREQLNKFLATIEVRNGHGLDLSEAELRTMSQLGYLDQDDEE